ncbi:MAG: tyrosine-type recombinase/integrase [Gammaproteobacteria bacterium]
MTPIAPHITAFLRERLPLQRGASEHTCDSYSYAFQLLFEFASERLRVTPSALCLEQLDASLVMDFLQHLEIKRHNSARTRNARLVAIKSFMRFVEHRVPASLEQSRRILAIPAKRTESRLINYLTLEEMQAVLNAPDLRRRHGIRDRAMLHLCFSAGLRVSELVGLPLQALEWQPSPNVRIQGKGRRERVLPLWKQTAVDLRAWLGVRGQSPAPELFINAREQPMTRSGFEYVLKKHVQAAVESCPSLKTKRISPHALRHTAAILVLQATGDIRKVSLWLGHTELQTTEAYLRADPTEKLEAMSAFVLPTLKRGRFRAPDRLISSLHHA